MAGRVGHGVTFETKKMAQGSAVHEIAESWDGDTQELVLASPSDEDMGGGRHSDWQAAPCPCPCPAHSSYQTLAEDPSPFERELCLYRPEQRRPSLHVESNHLWILASSRALLVAQAGREP
jgi:hypothetical protein